MMNFAGMARHTVIAMLVAGLGAATGGQTATAAGAIEKRCGWLANPTPGNFWLTDRHGEWTISEQGANLRNGFQSVPAFDFGTEWVRTNGYYGYGCACFVGAVDFRSRLVTRIDRLDPIPLSRCLNDPALPSH